LKTHYETLGVTAKAGGADIDGAYKALIKRHHPDRRGPDAAADDETAKAINEAYRVLRDPEKRAQYDFTIGLGPSPGTQNVYLYADDIDDRPFWIGLGVMVLAALVIFVAAHVSSERWLATHKNEGAGTPVPTFPGPAAPPKRAS